MKFSELSKAGVADQVTTRIFGHTETLRKLLISSGDRAEQFLVLTNGGAAIALLSFMAASERIRELPAIWRALMWFASGVAFCGLLAAANFHVRRSEFWRWIADTDRFLADVIDEQTLYGELNRRAKSFWGSLPVVFGYAAFACLIMGAVTAFKHLAR
jgi:hypothetical protein